MKQISLDAKKREETGKTLVKLSRRQALIPGVVYGKKTKSLPIVIGLKELEKILIQGAAHKIVKLQIASNGAHQEKMCMIQEIQRDALGSRILHVDFHHISMEEKIEATVPLSLQGDPAGLKEGGVLDHVLWEIEVKALPMNLPEKLTLDVSALLINQSLHVKDIPVPEGVEVIHNLEEVVVVVHPPRVEELPTAVATTAEAGAAAAAPAQPEVISKGKKEEEEPAAAETAKPKK